LRYVCNAAADSAKSHEASHAAGGGAIGLTEDRRRRWPSLAPAHPQKLQSGVSVAERGVCERLPHRERQHLVHRKECRRIAVANSLAAFDKLSSYTLEQHGELGLNLFPNAREGNTATDFAQ